MAEPVVVETGAGGLPRARVSGARAEAELSLQGAHLTRWQPRGAAPVLFYLGALAVFDFVLNDTEHGHLVFEAA